MEESERSSFTTNIHQMTLKEMMHRRDALSNRRDRS